MVALTFIGRILSFLCVLALPTLGAYTLFTKMDTVVDKGNVLLMCVYSICICILLALFEIPSLCTCYSGCVVVGKYTRIVSGFWIPRAAALVGIAAGGIAIYAIQLKQQVDKDAVLYQLLTYVTVLVAATLYLVGHIYYKEPNPAGSSGSSPTSSPSKAADGAALGASESSFSSFLFKKAATAAAKDPEGAAKIATAVAPSAAQLMFGGFGGSSSTTIGRENTAVKGFYDEETAPAAPAAPYRPPEIDAPKKSESPKSGAIFGAGSSKAAKYSLGSSAEDVPEAVRDIE